jgi:hypothetical protein
MYAHLEPYRQTIALRFARVFGVEWTGSTKGGELLTFRDGKAREEIRKTLREAAKETKFFTDYPEVLEGPATPHPEGTPA